MLDSEVPTNTVVTSYWIKLLNYTSENPKNTVPYRRQYYV